LLSVDAAFACDSTVLRTPPSAPSGTLTVAVRRTHAADAFHPRTLVSPFLARRQQEPQNGDHVPLSGLTVRRLGTTSAGFCEGSIPGRVAQLDSRLAAPRWLSNQVPSSR
jgi:hypothetical protein